MSKVSEPFKAYLQFPWWLSWIDADISSDLWDKSVDDTARWCEMRYIDLESTRYHHDIYAWVSILIESEVRMKDFKELKILRED